MIGSPLFPQVSDELDRRLAAADAALVQRGPIQSAARQPIHTLYLPADRITTAGTAIAAAAGLEALAVLDEHAADAAGLATALGWSEHEVAEVLPRVRAKLAREPVEDLRLDLEDGYGTRPDDEEDRHAIGAAHVLAQLAEGRSMHDAAAVDATALPPFLLGVRVKSLEPQTRRRALRTLDLVVSHLVEEAGRLPAGFVVTLPKVTSVDQVRAFVYLCEQIESAYGIASHGLRFEVQVETPEAILGADGTATVAAAVGAADGRCIGLHYGTYDYSAALGIAAAYQSMEHPAADHAKAVMQLAAAGSRVRVSDGSTNVLPVGDRSAIHAAWALHARLVRRSLERGFYQGWDLHAAQLPTRYLATYAFYRQGLAAAAMRLRAYESRSASGVLDEPATAYALASFLLRGVDCGALDLDEVTSATDLDESDLKRHGRRSGG